MVSPTTDRRLGLVGNQAVKKPVQAATTAAIALSGEQTIDGVAVLASNAAGIPDRVLVKDQASGAANGIYDVSTGSWTRSKDANGNFDLCDGTLVLVNGGTINGGIVYQLTTNDPITIDTSTLTWQASASVAFLASLASIASAALGSGLVGYSAQLAYAADTVGAELRNIRWATDRTSAGAGVVMGVVSGAQRILNVSAINQHIQDLGGAGGGTLMIPFGRLECDGTLAGFSCDPVVNTVQVNVRGMGKDGTKLFFYNNTNAVNLQGADITHRIITNWSDFTIDGSNGGASLIAFKLGWNQRSQPLLARMRIALFAHYGLDFEDQNWNVSFDCIELDQCGRTAANSAGIFKNAAVDSGTFNAIEFHNLQVESCGVAGSAAGGINMQTTTANRGLHFSGTTIIEGNLGTDEAYFTNMADLVFDNLYIERNNVAGQTTGLEVSGCKGAIKAGYVTGSNTGNNLYGIQIKNSSEFMIGGVSTNTWGTGGIVNYSSKIFTGRNTATYANGDSAAQWYGDYAPRFSANKNATNQTGIATATFTKVTFGTKRYDFTGAYLSSSSIYQPLALGAHHIEAAVGWVGIPTANTRMDIAIYYNGAIFKNMASYAQSTAFQQTQISADIDILSSTDTIEIYARQQSTANADISGSAADSWFMGHAIGRTTT